MSQYKDKKKPPAWFGMDVWGATVCFNTVEAQKKNIPKPETWKDLTKPVYKGQIVMPNPASSGTGYFDVTAWLTMFGDDKGKGGGWKYMDGLHENIAQYTPLRLQALQHGGGRRVRGRHLVRIPRQHQQGQGRADRPGVPQGRPGLGPGSLRHPQGHQEAGRRQEAGRLGVEQGRDDAVRQELRHHRAAGPGAAAGQRAQGLRGAPGQDGLQVGRRQPRAHPGRVDQALQQQDRKDAEREPQEPGGARRALS